MKKIFNTYFILMVLPLCFSACHGNKAEHSEEEEEETAIVDGIVELTEEQMSTIGLTIGDVESKQMSGTIQTTGTLKLSPQNRAEVTSLINGITRKILVKEGDAVRAGQTLALVENTEIVALQKEYLIASRKLTLARQAYKRQEAIRAEGAGVEKNLQEAKAELDIASVTEQGLKQQLQQLGINTAQVAQGRFSNTSPVKSPINGVVGEILISTGSYLDSEIKLMDIYDNKALHADLNVFESDISNINVGQLVDMQLSDQSRTVLTGKVSFITASMDKESKSASVHVDIDKNEGVILLPNMFVSASIHCEHTECQAVPNEALVINANRSFVFVSLGKGKFQQTEVIAGISQQGYTQITFVNKPASTPKIVTKKAFYLQSMIADHGEED